MNLALDLVSGKNVLFKIIFQSRCALSFCPACKREMTFPDWSLFNNLEQAEIKSNIEIIANPAMQWDI